MDYQKFFAEIAEWINQSNQMAVKHGMNSDTFWQWVAKSSGELCDKYGNNQLVKKQMEMLYKWLEDFIKGRE